MARFKPKQFARAGLVRPTVDALCHMCAEPDPPGHDDDDDSLPPAKIASQVHCSRLNVPSVRLHVEEYRRQQVLQHLHRTGSRLGCATAAVMHVFC